MRDLIPLKGVYKTLGWDVIKRDEAISDFISVIKENHLIGFGVAVHKDTWKAVVPEEIRKTQGNTHQFCFARIMRMLVDRMKRSGIDDFFSITFDTDREFASARFNLFSEIWNRDPQAREYLASISFADVVKHPQLQAADLLAWETRKDLIQKNGGYESTARWTDLFAALPGRSLDYESQLWDESAIKTQLLPELSR
jgi:hypothetical protein